MKNSRILVIGGGIGGLTSAIALRRKGFDVEIIERDPHWSVYGVGIIQQSNVVREMAALELLENYLDAGFGFDFVEIYMPDGDLAARIPSPKLAGDGPANVGISRRALQNVLGDRAKALGTKIRLGVTADSFDDDGEGVVVRFSDETEDRYDLVIGADGIYSQTRSMIFPDAPKAEFVGQAVWRYNLPRPADLDCLQSYQTSVGVGLVPLSEDLMYMFVTTPEPGNPRYPREGLAARMRSKIEGLPPAIRELGEQITNDDEVVYKPLEWVFVTGEWHKGRIVLLGDAIHATTPHLGQGAGMAIEDSIVLAEELERAATPDEAFRAYRERRIERARFIVETSLAICRSQLGTGPFVDQAKAVHDMFAVVSEPI